ncbi:MAG: hypothetical protein WAP58_10080 [Peptococcia bacterium]
MRGRRGGAYKLRQGAKSGPSGATPEHHQVQQLQVDQVQAYRLASNLILPK